MRSQNGKSKERGLLYAGGGMLLLLIALACPVTQKVEAVANEERTNLKNSSVTITFTPNMGVGELTPLTSAGDAALVTVKAKVDVQNSGGYTVYLGSSSANLIGKNNSDWVIEPVATATKYKDLPVNSWGYYAGLGESVPETAEYKAVRTGRGEAIYVDETARIKHDEKDFVLGFAARIGNDVPSDVYESQVTVSVVSSPLEMMLEDIDEMQEMTPEICALTPTPAADQTEVPKKQLTDTRDGKKYWVSKLKDGNCWMTQNLDYVLDTAKKLTNEKSNVGAAGWTPQNSTILSGTPSAFNNGDIALVASFRSSEPEKYGVYYSFAAATAGAGSADVTSGNITTSVCPRGWTLPAHSQYSVIINGMTSGDSLIASPYNFMYGGRVSNGNVDYAGGAGYYWSGTVNDGSTEFIVPFDPGAVWPSGVTMRYNGCTVRCVAE